MEKSEAFDILGLFPDASDEEIEEKFRELVLEKHPDAGGTEQELDELQEARDVALSRTLELAKAETSISRYSGQNQDWVQRRDESEKVVDHLKRRHTSRIRQKRHLSLLFGGLVGLMLLAFRFITSASPQTFPLFSAINDPIVITVIVLYGISFGGASLFYHTRVKSLEAMINEADELLEDKMRIIKLLEEIGVDHKDTESFNRDQLIGKVENWCDEKSQTTKPRASFLPLFFPKSLDFEELAHLIGATDFARLVTRKALEKGVIEESESVEGGEWRVEYRLSTPDPPPYR